VKQEQQVRRIEVEEAQDAGLGMSLPVFLVLWLVCAIAAGISWQNLVDNTPATTPLHLSVPALLVLSISFGLPTAGLIAMAVAIFRRG
jgi:hypothetical protein